MSPELISVSAGFTWRNTLIRVVTRVTCFSRKELSTRRETLKLAERQVTNGTAAYEKHHLLAADDYYDNYFDLFIVIPVCFKVELSLL